MLVNPPPLPSSPGERVMPEITRKFSPVLVIAIFRCELPWTGTAPKSICVALSDAMGRVCGRGIKISLVVSPDPPATSTVPFGSSVPVIVWRARFIFATGAKYGLLRAPEKNRTAVSR